MRKTSIETLAKIRKSEPEIKQVLIAQKILKEADKITPTAKKGVINLVIPN
jgi:hypothetical protein